MNAEKVDMFILTNAKYFETSQINLIRSRLIELDETKWNAILALQFKDPTIGLIVSILGGSLGIDRFLIGDIGLGVGKLLTCGGFGVWTIVDWFLIQSATRDKNIQLLQQYLY